jgi:lipopolysaccharide biosynthesis regulator YciM
VDIWLFSLVLVAILIGWIIGRWKPSIKKLNEYRSGNYPASYIKGLNYLLSDNSQKAVEIFSELIQVNTETIEIHIALGNLYRSKGEVDRAIKIHQNLLARPNLSRSQRNMAIAELANDYLKSGLLDRAENLFKELTQLEPKDPVAYRNLLDLYITEKSWSEAASYAKILSDRGDKDAAIILSHCFCEIADEALAGGNNKLVRESLDKALDADQACVRAGLLLIKHHMGSNNTEAAKKVFHRLISNNPEYMDLYIAPAREIYLLANQSKEYQKFLQNQYEYKPSNRLAIALIEHYASVNQVEKARQFLSEVLEKLPSVEAYEFALRFQKPAPISVNDTWNGLSVFLKSMKDKKAEFVCSQCGYESHAIQWNCPSCRRWSSMKPVQLN